MATIYDNKSGEHDGAWYTFGSQKNKCNPGDVVMWHGKVHVLDGLLKPIPLTRKLALAVLEAREGD